MPRYYFDIEADPAMPDSDGTEFPDADTARAFAEGLATTLQPPADEPQSGAVVIRSEDGEFIRRVEKP